MHKATQRERWEFIHLIMKHTTKAEFRAVALRLSSPICFCFATGKLFCFGCACKPILFIALQRSLPLLRF